MRILILTNTLDIKNGWGRYSVDLINAYTEQNHEVTVICTTLNPEYPHITQIAALPHPLNFFQSYISSLKYFFKIRSQLKDQKFDVIHTFVESYAFITTLLAKSLKVKYFITIHGSYGIKCFSKKIYKWLQIYSYKRAQNVICVSSYTKERVGEYVKLNNIEIIPNGLNTESFPKQEIKKNKNNTILTVGGVKRRKGYHTVVKAVAEIKKVIPDIQYTIVGDQLDTKYVNEIKKLIAALNLQDTIHFYENISDSQLREIYKDTKIFILSSVSSVYDFEGFGLVYLEANSFGIPVIGSFETGAVDAIKDGSTGFLVPQESPEAIAQHVVALVQDPQKYEAMTIQAQQWAMEHSWELISLRYTKLYSNK